MGVSGSGGGVPSVVFGAGMGGTGLCQARQALSFLMYIHTQFFLLANQTNFTFAGITKTSGFPRQH